ncbi:MAG: protein tyrosine phosphatase [Myxococcales bacterium]|nr:protein tyrosine phosphatase [Myxococcales bacterium]
MSFVDLHSHVIPAVDDGVKTLDDARALLRGLRSLGFAHVVATPHIRTALFENEPAALRRAFDALVAALGDDDALPSLGLAAEHHVDDVVFEKLAAGDGLPYPGGRAALVELPETRFPLGIDGRFFDLMVRGVRPVVAHPERYAPLFRGSEPLATWVSRGVGAQLDLMSLVGRYGKNQQRAAERMLDQGLYLVAASDAHKPEHLPLVEAGLLALERRVGASGARALLVDGPRALLGEDAAL